MDGRSLLSGLFCLPERAAGGGAPAAFLSGGSHTPSYNSVVLESDTDMIHANAHHMAVAVEPFAEARARSRQARSP